VNTVGLIGVTEIVARPDKEPVPDRFAVCGLVLALSLMLRVPVLAPSAVGVNVIEIVHLDPAASVLGDTGQSEVCAKSPEAEIPEIVSALDWLFFTMMGLGALVVVKIWIGKGRLLVDRLTGATLTGTVLAAFRI
jgi:hypothetical protein